MLSLNYKRSIFQICEEIGTGTIGTQKMKPDIIIRFELLFSPLENSKLNKKKFSFRLLIPNYLIDLEEDENLIYSKIHKNTRYKINRAMNRDELLYFERSNPSDTEIEEFKLFFNPFAKERNIRSCDENKLKALRDQGALIISFITDKNGNVLCYHVYQKEEQQGYLIYSASTRYNIEDSGFRNLIGRANRYLHWKDILSFKEKGCKWYNFGGKILNKEDNEGQNVNQFKLEFGPVTGFDSRIFYSNSLLGKVGLIPLFIKWRNSSEYKFSKNFGSVKNMNYKYDSHEC
ncbi:lipid II:glycine glycyltransferase (peptidoglycan interpeptide bridge formation enzyme) [Bacillus sp. SORGH_AS 510]|uniref:hypothetical protein n=1 Tax=Bacillus sp. SORGH_AS_0510 TaxID=3041771 RepID=UPI0027861E4E|nr:hypothetical protein [Bacillus sp. SORGH_AS_0510]MDQ1144593.1 lipid II:glycine glycyltransferase (peptidoglycan interpeptide bridge formation enzyme) [Bacillus sp. SORGH_AS_0510]